MAVAVKVYVQRPLGWHPSIHRLELTEPYSFDDLSEKVKQLIDQAPVISLRWQDEERDLVSLQTDQDLQLGCEYAKSHGKGTLRVYASVGHAGEQPGQSPMQAGVGAPADSAVASEPRVTYGAEPGSVQKRGGGDVEKKWPVRDLPGGGRYSGYIRTTGPDGKTIEREMSVEEAQDLMHSGSGWGAGVFADPWRPLRRPSFPSLFAGHHPFALPHYF